MKKERGVAQEGKWEKEKRERRFNSQSQGPNPRFSLCGTLRQRSIGGKENDIDLMPAGKKYEKGNEGERLGR